MNCPKVRSYLSASCDGSLQSDLLREMEAHVRNCKSCEREKLYFEEILAAARSLPQKQVAEDFNLRLMNRIFSEQNSQSESFMPLREPSVFSRPLTWISSLAAVGAAVLAFVLLRTDKAPELMESSQVITASAVSQAQVATPNAQFASTTQRQEPASIWEDILGVSGESSHYRATNVQNVRSLHLSDAKRESLYVEYLRKMGKLPQPYNRQNATFASQPFQTYRQFNRPINARNQNTPESPLIRNAAWR
jgi:hypothetical protein